MLINYFIYFLNYSCCKLEVINIIVIQNDNVSNMIFIFLCTRKSVQKNLYLGFLTFKLKKIDFSVNFFILSTYSFVFSLKLKIQLYLLDNTFILFS